MKRKVLQWLTQPERMERYPFLRRMFWRRVWGKQIKKMERHARCLRQKEVINVAFIALNLPCWKCDSVFRLMQQHPRFRPIIWIVPELQIKDADERQRNLEQMRAFFAGRGYPVADMYSLEQLREEFAPDIVFLAKPYRGVTLCNIEDLDKELVCYVPYTYHNTERDGFRHGTESRVWRNFFSTKSVRKQACAYMSNGGLNVRVTGHPIADAFLFPSQFVHAGNPWMTVPRHKKRIIWAPHWSVCGDTWFKTATFITIAEGMLKLVEKYADNMHFAFKPHPLLRDSLYRHPEWGRERTDAYYERWSSLPNAQLETGDYVELFKGSDAMIHDSGSFIIEYLLVDRPCMFLFNENSAFIEYNEDTREALACYRKGESVRDIEVFLLEILNDAPDENKKRRARYKTRYLVPPGSVSAAQNIVNCILSGR